MTLESGEEKYCRGSREGGEALLGPLPALSGCREGGWEDRGGVLARRNTEGNLPFRLRNAPCP